MNKALFVGLATIAASALGCSRSAQQSGIPESKVAEEIQFSEGAVTALPSSSEHPLHAGRNESFLVEGSFRATPEITQNSVIVQVTLKNAKGKRVIHNEGLVPLEKVGEGQYRFSGKAPSPATPGAYAIEVKVGAQRIISDKATFVAPPKKAP